MKDLESKNKLLQNLTDFPVVGTACKKSGIGRSTYYRWLKEDKSFKKQAKQALNEGVLGVNDLCEENLITMITDKDLQAMKYWLQFHHDTYSRNGYIPVIYADKKRK